jgi:hypothetical protein
MSFTDPQSIKIAGTTISLPRVSVGQGTSSYLSEDGLTKVTISSVQKTRKRHTFRVDVSKITTDPFIPTQNTEVSMSAYIVVDRPSAGYLNSDALNVVKGLLEVLSATEYAAVKKLVAFES